MTTPPRIFRSRHAACLPKRSRNSDTTRSGPTGPRKFSRLFANLVRQEVVQVVSQFRTTLRTLAERNVLWFSWFQKLAALLIWRLRYPRLKRMNGICKASIRPSTSFTKCWTNSPLVLIQPSRWPTSISTPYTPSAGENLPFPTKSYAARFVYRCPNCRQEFPRVRRARRAIACLSCCRKHNGGEFDARFRLKLLNSC